MGKYTTYKEKWVDNQIQDHINLAVKNINQYINGVRSIILIGGFGRGEGSVKLEDKKMIPLNDYDIYVILDGGLTVSEEKSRELMDNIEKQAGTSGFSLYESSSKEFYFDIRFININKIKKLPPFIKHYEMKHSSYIVYGDDVRNLIPEYKKEDLPVSDGLRFALNRLSSILLWVPVDLIKEEKIPIWKKDAILYDVSKLYIEMCTVLSQIAGVYAPTYKSRIENLRNVYDKKFKLLKEISPNLLDKMDYYTSLKLSPKYEEIDNHLDRWFEARDDSLKVIKFVLSESFNCDFDSFKSGLSKKYFKPYLKSIIKMKFKINSPRLILLLANFTAQVYLSLIWFMRIIKFKKKIYPKILMDLRDPGIKIFESLVFISDSLNKNGTINIDKLKKGVNALEKVFPVGIKVNDDLDNFANIVDVYINAWKLYYFQNIA